MLSSSYRVARVEKTLRHFEGDIPLLNLRIKDLSVERQHSAREFAQALVNQTRAELHRLLAEQPQAIPDSAGHESGEVFCEPAD